MDIYSIKYGETYIRGFVRSIDLPEEYKEALGIEDLGDIELEVLADVAWSLNGSNVIPQISEVAVFAPDSEDFVELPYDKFSNINFIESALFDRFSDELEKELETADAEKKLSAMEDR